MSGLTICALCEHICQPPLRIEPVQCLAGVSLTEKTDFVTGRTVVVYDKEPCLCSERNRTGHCALFDQQVPGKLTIIEAPQRRHWWQQNMYGPACDMYPDREKRKS
jgi:hypothetical protein